VTGNKEVIGVPIMEASPTKEFDLFQGVSQRVIAEIGKLGEEVSFTRDDVIFKGDEPGSFFYELVEGEVDIIVLEKENMHFIVKRPGEIFGWSALVDPYVYSATARCLAPTRVIRIGRDVIENVVKRHPEEGLIIYKHIIGIVAQRLRSAYQYIYRQH
jgi:CRP-like cAMP-binding protein